MNLFRLDSIIKEISELKKEFNELDKQKEKINKQVNELNSNVNGLKNTITSYEARKADLEQEFSHLSREINKKKISYRPENEPPIIIKRYEDRHDPTDAIKQIGYTPNNSFPTGHYPYVSMPQENSLVKFPSKGRLGQRGFTEPHFEEHLKTYFLRQRNIQFFNDRYLIISDGTIPYEPDFVLIDERDNLNLLIDIEIDEPYDGVERYAMHFIGDDEFRNQYFNDRGWIVIRFSEKQVHLYPLGCCRYIAEVIDSVNPKFTIPQQLIEIPIVNEEPFWTKLQAEKWAQENYRENYLETLFSANSKVIIEADNLKQNETEKEIERKLPKPKWEEDEMDGKLNELNRHHRDSRIIFYPKPHLYLIDRNPRTIPASNLVRRFFKDFDSLHWAEIKANQRGITIEEQLAEWEHIRQDAANLGTELHLDIEVYFNSDKTKIPKNKKEFNHFLRFYDDHLSLQKQKLAPKFRQQV